ncbi:MAG: hypothetical protein JWL68_708 [Actinomycetia bacterium]|nr:hypothetical protein [Actinomycetes bacterium]
MAEVPTKRLKLEDKRGLSPPFVGAPLYWCASAVIVYGFDVGALLDVQVNGNTVLAGVPGGFPQPQEALLHLPAQLQTNVAVPGAAEGRRHYQRLVAECDRPRSHSGLPSRTTATADRSGSRPAMQSRSVNGGPLDAE